MTKLLRVYLYYLLPFLFFSFGAFGYSELNGDFHYEKQVYGEDRQNSTVSRTYAGSLATYFTSNFAFELNYSHSKNITTEHENIPVSGTTAVVDSTQNRVINIVYGAGIRWLMTSRQSRIRPHISIGYATQEVESATDYTFRDTASETSYPTLTTPVEKQSIKSVFGAFALQIGITQYFAIKGSVQTVFEAFKTEKARDNLKYMVGLSWIF
ncbi:MAG: hypothetical protein HYV97_19785 [Bdellovibrio sp.]|nr:hypothetical protein [Bdellovibrio sp.]